MTTFPAKLRAVRLLGIGNVVRVALYRIGLRTQLHPVRWLRVPAKTAGACFRETRLPPVAAEPAAGWTDNMRLYGAHDAALAAQPPNWLADALSGEALPDSNRPWWRIPDFGQVDIKNVWEPSRMEWALVFAQRARNGDSTSLQRLNLWLADWQAVNPPFRGPNWKCGQESSLRLINLAAAALILGQERDTEPALLDLVTTHLRRVAPTLSYAAGQCNNHATSEAAALFIGGSWLAANGRREGSRHARMGRKRLERYVAQLFEEDGSFSQYSLNYHRLALDTLSMAEVWRRRLDLVRFSARWLGRAGAATHWLAVMVDEVTGDGPNLGANDGARLIPLTPTPYRDYRPSVQLAAALFQEQRAYPPGPHDGGLAWLGVPAMENTAPPLGSEMFDQGGYAVLRRDQARAILTYPRYRFRPSQADALHLDFWVDGRNLLRDGGSYSYNDPEGWTEYFAGTGAHNTIQFDDDDQMPRLGRFLFGDWLKTDELEPLRDDGRTTRFAAGYRDRQGRAHRREVLLERRRLKVIDRVEGFARKAVLRWRLMPGQWLLRDGVLVSGEWRLAVRCDRKIVRMEVGVGHESRHYQERSALPVLEVEVGEPAQFTTELWWPE